MDEHEAERTVRLLLYQAIDKLGSAAELLRGPHVPASPHAMRLEMAVTRALDTLAAAAEARKDDPRTV